MADVAITRTSMPPAERRPLRYPAGVSLPFTGEDFLRRLTRQCMVGDQSRVLLLGAGLGAAETAAYLASTHDPELVIADPDEAALAQVQGVLEAEGLASRARFERVDPAALPFGEQEFSSIWVDAQVLSDLEAAVKALRPHLVLKGRLCLQWPVRVGRHPRAPLVRAWELRLGHSLLLPREVLGVMERHGYEPQMIEALEDSALSAFYAQVSKKLGEAQADGGASLREEVTLFEAQNGRSAVSFSVSVGRRKEPGEKPPPSRAE